jgi:hypothetical protein
MMTWNRQIDNNSQHETDSPLLAVAAGLTGHATYTIDYRAPRLCHRAKEAKELGAVRRAVWLLACKRLADHRPIWGYETDVTKPGCS